MYIRLCDTLRLLQVNKDWSALIDHAQKCNAIHVIDQPEISVKCILTSNKRTPQLKYICSDDTTTSSTHLVKTSTFELSSLTKSNQPSTASAKNQVEKPQARKPSSAVNPCIMARKSRSASASEISDRNDKRALHGDVRRHVSSSSEILCGTGEMERVTGLRSGVEVGTRRDIEHPLIDMPTDPRIQRNIMSGSSEELRVAHSELAAFPRQDSRSHSTNQATRIARISTVGQNVGTREKLERLKANDTINKSQRSSVSSKKSNLREQLAKSIKHT